MKLYKNISQLVTLRSAYKKDGRFLKPNDLDIIENGAIVFDNEKIVWLGSTHEIPTAYSNLSSFDLTDHTLTPEMVDSHTHIVFGGDRSTEYAKRLNGVSYEEIAKAGGGILFTMNETQNSSSETLFQNACERIEKLHSYGIGAIEVKSGYGLTYEEEKRMSLIIHDLKKEYEPKIKIFNTYLAAHDVPKSFSSSKQYMDEVVLPLLEELAPLNIIDAVDIFHEKNYFTDEDTKRLFEKAQKLNIARKIHADELNTNAGAELAAAYKALSADHLLKISDIGIHELAQSSTVATILPGTAFFLGKPLAPAQKMMEAGVKLSIASDFNPGSCHCDNVLMIASISAAQLKLNQAQLWCGITLNAAHSLGYKDQGVLDVGFRPRFSLFKSKSLDYITYKWGYNLSTTCP